MALMGEGEGRERNPGLDWETKEKVAVREVRSAAAAGLKGITMEWLAARLQQSGSGEL